MYISGVPGTGKTATVKEVMKILEEERDDGNLNDFAFIEINGMRLTEPRQAYVEILKVCDVLGLQMAAMVDRVYSLSDVCKWSEEAISFF